MAIVFDIDQAVEAANHAMAKVHGRLLTDVEILVLKGAWERDSYDQIAARNQYSTSYLSQDIAPKLWKLLSDALGERIKKNSLKEPLKRYWEGHLQGGDTAAATAPPGTSFTAFTHGVSLPGEGDLPYPNYIRRPEIEDPCFETLLNYPGALIRIKSPKLTGKTSFINYVLSRLAAQGLHTINLSLRMADRQSHFTTIDVFLRWFCFNLEQELELESKLNDYWNAEWLGSKVSCTTYFEKYLLAQDDAPVVLCLDDIDLLFAYPDLYEDFFGLLRSWYEKARSRPQWKKLRLILSHSTEAYIRLNMNQSPFNVGLPVDLPEFTPAQVEQMARRIGLDYSTADVEPLTTLLGGHPYLLEKAFNYLHTHPHQSLEEFLTTAATQAGIYGNHLQKVWNELRQHSDLETAFSTVIHTPEAIAIEPHLAYQLQSMGLVKLVGNRAQAACQLYRDYFLANLHSSGAEAQPSPLADS